MPNDPRVKFKKKVYDASRNILYFQGSGGGGRMGSITEEGGFTPPDPGGGGTGGGGTGGGGGGGVTPRDIAVIPQPLKPDLNPGDIAGITIGSLAAAAALTEAARRTLEEQRRRRGMRPVPQTGGSLSSRQSGVGGGRQRSGLGISRGIGRAIDTTGQSFEMTLTRPTGPIQSEFAPLSIVSSPSSSGASTPLDTPDLQSSRSRPSSGASTPEINISSIRPGARQFQQQPSALAPIPPPPAPAPAPAPVSEIIPPIDQLKQIKSEITLIENQLVTETNSSIKNAMKEQLKILKKQATTLEKTMPARPAPAQAPDIQSARSRPNNYEGRVTEKGINRWGQAPTEVGDRPASVVIRDPKHSSLFTALDNDPNRLSTIFTTSEGTLGKIEASAIPKPAPPIREPPKAPTNILNLQNELEKRQIMIEDPNISEGRIKTLQSEIRILERQIETLGGDTAVQSARNRAAPAQVERPAPPPESVAANTRSRTGTELNQQLELVAGQEAQTRIQETLIPRQQRSSEKLKLADADLAKVNAPLQERYLSGRRTTYINQIKKANNEINRLLSNKQIPELRRRALLQQQEEYRILIQEVENPRISKTLTTEVNTTIETPANDNLRATQPTREFESRLRPVAEIEMRPLQKEYFPEIGEIVQAAMQQMGSRRPLERARVGQIPQSERIIGPEFSEAHAAGVGIDFNAPRPPPRPAEDRMAKSSEQTQVERPATEQRPEIEPMGSRPPPTETAPEMTRPPEPTRRPRPVEEMGEEIGGLRTQNAIAELNDIHDFMMESAKQEGFIVPEAPESIKAQGELEVKRYQYEQALEFAEREGLTVSDVVIERGQRKLTGKALSKKKQLQQFQEVYERARIQEGGRPSARAATAPREVTATRTAAPEARAAPAEMRTAPAEMRTAPEAMSARSVLAPEVSARVPLLTAPDPAGPRVRAQVQSINTTKKPVAPPIESAGPSPPPSAPGSGTATPQEGATTERTPAERASLAEEVSAGLNKKPSRQKAKITNGKTKTTVNPLERFVAPQFRNAPNVEIHPGSKSLMGSLSELGARVPRLVPTRQVLLDAGHMALTEGGGAAAGFFAGSYAGQKMNEYFATHPPKNRGEEFGQALATSMVALGVGNLVSKVVTYVIRQGARVAAGAEIAGSISSGGTAGASAILEAAVFATIATTTQFYVTKALEDSGSSHANARALGSLYATDALLTAEVVAWLAKGGPVNLAGDASFIASELFILGFGIYSVFEEYAEGKKQDEEEEATRVEREQAAEERRVAVAKINNMNYARADFMKNLQNNNFDFDKSYDRLTAQQRVDIGIDTPETKAAFQRQIESSFDPLGVFEEPTIGVEAPPVLSQEEKDRREVFNNYINWYLNDLRKEQQPPFDFNDPKVIELNEYSGGTWESAARVSATTSYMQSERVHPLIEKAQNEIIDAFHNERKTIDTMPAETIRYADLDPNFRKNYEDYIVSEAAAQILIQFNETQHTYNDVDPALLAIADRDPTFRAAADAYYQVLANQARDLNLSIPDIVYLNSLMETQQSIEIGKLNDARNAIIQKNMASNQAQIDAYNANIIQSINIYGDNFEAIIRNINEQSLLSGHTFLYASNKADLYRQLHLEMPVLELVDPGDEEDQPDATWHPAKGRKVGDTVLYGYRHYLTDEQNQELEDMIARGEITREQEEDQALIIGERDRWIYEETDPERAASLGMTLTEYYDKFGITEDPYKMEVVDVEKISEIPKNGRVRQPNGTIYTYRNGRLVNKERPIVPTEIVVPYDPALEQQPDGRITMPDGSVRTYKNGRVIEVYYPAGTTAAEALTPDQINEQSGNLSYGQLKTKYPDAYQTLLKKYAGDPDADAKIEETLARGHKTGLYNPNPVFDPGTNPDGTPILSRAEREEINKQLAALRGQTMEQFYMENPWAVLEPEEPVEPVTPITPEIPIIPGVTQIEEVTPVEPKINVLFTGDKKMPNKSIRTYKDGKIIAINYPPNTPLSRMDDDDLTPEGIAKLNQREGLYYDPNPSTTPTTGTPTEGLKNGVVKMPDGSIRTYKNGLVIIVDYPTETINTKNPAKNPAQINKEEGTQNASYTGPVVAPTIPKSELQQGLVKMPDGSKRVYIDGKVVSVAYPEGVTGPTINQINAAEGIKKAEPDSNNPVNPVAPVDPGGLPTQIQTPTTPTTPTQPDREPTYEELQVMYSARYQQYSKAYANEYKYTTTLTSPEEQAMMIEGLLRAEHTNRTEAGTASPLPPTTTTPTPTPTTNQPLPMVPGARSYEYADSGTQPTQTTTTPTTTTPSGAGPSDYRPRQQEPMQ
jgi:hypothetical protein